MRPGLMTCSTGWRSGGAPGAPSGAARAAGEEQDADRAGGAEPVTGAQHPAVQRLRFSCRSLTGTRAINDRRLELLLAESAIVPHSGGVVVLDDRRDRKDGIKTTHVGHQYLGQYGRTDNGVVTATTVWAEERLYYRVNAVPYTPARHFAKGKNDAAFGSTLKIRADLAVRPRDGGSHPARFPRTTPTGDQDGFRGRAGRGRVAVRDGAEAVHESRAYSPDVHTPVDAARALAWGAPDDPGDSHPVERTFRDGHAEACFAAGAALGWGDPMARSAWWWPLPTRPPCPPRPPGTWSPTCHAPAAAAAAGPDELARGRLRPAPLHPNSQTTANDHHLCRVHASRRRKDKRKGFTAADYIRLLDGARLQHMQYQNGLIDGFLADTRLDVTPSATPQLRIVSVAAA